MNVEQMILYEDANIIVCHKAAGIPVQSAGVGTQDMISLLMNYLSEKQKRIPYLGLVHRLDQPVEGILVFAKNKKAASEFSRQISEGSIKKIYLAVCCKMKSGKCQEEGGTGSFQEKYVKKKSDSENGEDVQIKLIDFLKKDARTNTSAIVPEQTPGAKKSELLYEIMNEMVIDGKQYVLVKITLLTGRHHQIRVQMAGAGMPLYGDRKYHSDWESFRLQQWEQETETRLALCAVSLSFAYPAKKKKRMEFEIKPSAGVFRMFDET